MSHAIFGAHTKALCGLSEIPIGLNVLYFHLVYPTSLLRRASLLLWWGRVLLTELGLLSFQGRLPWGAIHLH